MTRFTFTCPLPAEDIARALVPVIWPGAYVSGGCPRFEDAPDRWELSNSNDHKLYLLGGDRYSYGDRYNDVDRVARVRAVVESLGGVFDAD